MNSIKWPHWLQATASTVVAMGGVGLFLVSLVDSSVIPLPSASDLLVIGLSVKNPVRMPYYAMMATLGSVLGCMALFYIARMGEEYYFRKHAGVHADRIHRWVKKKGFLAMLLGALGPPPTPFKLIVIAGGALEMPVHSAVLALIIAKAIRFFGLGYLAIRYGDQAEVYVKAHLVMMSFTALGAVAIAYSIAHMMARSAKKSAK